MSAGPSPLIGSILERKPAAAPTPPTINATKYGFPAVAHRSKSIFARAKQDPKNTTGKMSAHTGRDLEPPSVLLSRQTQAPPPQSGVPAGSGPEPLDVVDQDAWRKQISEENERRVSAMSEAEREAERREILEHFGPSIGGVLRRAREKREAAAALQGSRTDVKLEPVPFAPAPVRPATPPWGVIHGISKRGSPPPPPALVTGGSRPSSRNDRKLRFAELSPQDVYVYESAPPSPRRKPLALPPSLNDGSAVSLGQFAGKLIPRGAREEEGEKGEVDDDDEEDTDNEMPPLEDVADLPGPVTRAPAGPNLHTTGPPKPSHLSKSNLPPTPTPPLSNPDSTPDLEEGSPEYIRQRFFPNAPSNDPNLAWIQHAAQPHPPDTHTVRFDLSGVPIPAALSSTLPTHLGLHHHAEGAHAGYTLEDIILLTRSTVPAQRATMLGVLARVARRLGELHRTRDPRMREFMGRERALRSRIVAAGIQAMGERASTGMRAIEVVWECIARWHADELAPFRGVELEQRPRNQQQQQRQQQQQQRPSAPDGNVDDDDDAALNSIPMHFFLPQLAVLLAQGDLGPESLSQLLAILHRLARQSTALAAQIVRTPRLVTNVLRALVLTTPIFPPGADTPLPDPRALDLLVTLVGASRANARALLEVAEPLLRFVALLPSPTAKTKAKAEGSSHYYYPPRLANALAAATLRVYNALAQYGLGTSIASTAMMQLVELEKYVFGFGVGVGADADADADADNDNPSSKASEGNGNGNGKGWGMGQRELTEDYLELIQSWTVCAVDPHRTTPEHDILWSQIIAWAWDAEFYWRLRERRLGMGVGAGHATEGAVAGGERPEITVHPADWSFLSRIWDGISVWLEGSKVNAVRGGEKERADALEVVKPAFENGPDGAVLNEALALALRDLGAFSSLEAPPPPLPPLGSSPSSSPSVHFLQTLSSHMVVIQSAIRLWLSCLPPPSAGQVEAPPFILPFAGLSQLAANLVACETLWNGVYASLSTTNPPSSSKSGKPTNPKNAKNDADTTRTTASPPPADPADPPPTHTHTHIHTLSSGDGDCPSLSPTLPLYALTRPTTSFLARYLQLSRCLPAIPAPLWLAQALAILQRLGPGDEDWATGIADEVLRGTNGTTGAAQGVLVHTASGAAATTTTTTTTTTATTTTMTTTPSHSQGLEGALGRKVGQMRVWEKGGFAIVLPFVKDAIRPAPPVDERPESDDDGDEVVVEEEENVDNARELTVIGPLWPTVHSIKLATTLVLPGVRSRGARGKTKTGGGGGGAVGEEDYCKSGLPLDRDWTMGALNHLLKSATSPVFNGILAGRRRRRRRGEGQETGEHAHEHDHDHHHAVANKKEEEQSYSLLPSAWDADETEIVLVSLLLTLLSQTVFTRYKLPQFIPSLEETVFGCMKVFMLEEGTPASQSDSAIGEGEAEVFRNRDVGELMDEVLRAHEISKAEHGLLLLPLPPPSQTRVPPPGLEQAAQPFLGATPFYQYYTDFLGLYDAISFSHQTFARLLLPPTSMRYPVDFRKLLFGDYAHVLRTIRTEVGGVVGRSVWEWLVPVEDDPGVLGSYLGTLLKAGGGLAQDGFVRFVAVHHVAANIWEELNKEMRDAYGILNPSPVANDGGCSSGWNEERASRLAKAVLETGDRQVVKEVLRYQQFASEKPKAGEKALIPPACYELPLSDGRKKERLEWLRKWGGEKWVERFGILL